MKAAPPRIAGIGAIVLAASALAQTAIVAPHPTDLIREPGFQQSWAAAIKGETFVARDSWIAKLAGPGSGAFHTDGSGKQWIEGNVCQPRNCGDNHLVLLVDPVTKRMFALQRTRGETPAAQRFFGKPDERMRRLLVSRMMTLFP